MEVRTVCKGEESQSQGNMLGAQRTVPSLRQGAGLSFLSHHVNRQRVFPVQVASLAHLPLVKAGELSSLGMEPSLSLYGCWWRARRPSGPAPRLLLGLLGSPPEPSGPACLTHSVFPCCHVHSPPVRLQLEGWGTRENTAKPPRQGLPRQEGNASLRQGENGWRPESAQAQRA